jgi:hypothetical protein
MGLYPSDEDILYGWKSYGRFFAIGGGLALAAATVGFALSHHMLATPLEPASQMLAWWLEWIGWALFSIMVAAAIGSILISREERGGVEITPEGVRRIFRPGEVDFLPLDQIAGFMGRPSGGVLLIDRTGRRDMVIPRSIEDYRDCIAELRAIGVKPIPNDPKRVWGQNKRTLPEKLLFYTMCVLGGIYSSRGLPPLVHYLAGALLATTFLVTIIRTARTKGRFRLEAYLFGSIALAAVLWWFW